MQKLNLSARQQAQAAERGFAFIAMPRGEVAVRVNHGRWLADCPYCHGAEIARVGEPFYCMSCGMAGNAGHTMTARFPDDAAQIEHALESRPLENQNWTPGETVEQLIVENEEMKP